MEIPRSAIIYTNSTQVTLYFQLVDAVGAGKSTYSYFVYYGNPAAGVPPESAFSITPEQDLAPNVSEFSQGGVPEFEAPALMIAGIVAIAVFMCMFIRIRRA